MCVCVSYTRNFILDFVYGVDFFFTCKIGYGDWNMEGSFLDGKLGRKVRVVKNKQSNATKSNLKLIQLKSIVLTLNLSN